MKNRTIAIITTLFGTMLLGIVIIQAWWIKRSILLNARQFDAAVYRSLESVVKQVGQQENYTFMQSNIGLDSILHSTKKKELYVRHKPKKSPGNIVVSVTNNVSVVSKNGKTIVKVKKFNSDSGVARSYAYTYNGGNIESIGNDLNDMSITTDERDDNSAADIELAAVNKKIGDIDTLVKKMIEIQNPDSVTIKPDTIHKFLHGELVQNNLPDDFSFALLKPNGVYAYKGSSFKDTTGCYTVNLYPNDLFGRKVLLYVNIPGKYALVHTGIWWALALSLLFTAAMLALFIYSIRMLIKHRKLLAAKDDFINHMSHEFKTPLAGISLGADMLLQKSDKMNAEQIHKIAQTIKGQSTRLHKDMNTVLLNALLEEAPKRTFSPFNIIDALKTSLDEFQLLFHERNAKIDININDERAIVNGEEMLWQKVFSNLLDNALKFSGNGPHITVTAKNTANAITISITDSGIGIKDEDIPHIFEKFYRSNYYKQSNIQGFGLGLTFVKRVVELHHATIHVSSELNRGTTITIEIPTVND